MPKQMFDLDDRDLLRLKSVYQRAPREFAKATAGMLNTFGFKSRDASLDIIQQRMIVRSRGFVKSSVRVQMTRKDIPTNEQEVIYGSLDRPRFTGWVEQETGKRDPRRRTPMTFARGGDKRKRIKSGLRMKPGRTFRSSSEVKGIDDHHRAVVMLQIAFRQKGRRTPFLLKGHRTLPNGLYQIRSGSLHLVQSFEDPKTAIKRVRWMSGGVRRMSKQIDIRQLWGSELNRIFRKMR